MAIDWFGDKIEYPGLVELLQATCDSLFPDNTFNALAEEAATGDQIALMEYEDALAQILDASFSREPQLFGNILWIDTDLGTPMWVRPGEVWKPAHEFVEDETTAPKFQRSVFANRRAMIATGASVFEQAITNYTNKQLEAMRDTQ
jgi:hypothetical protein